MSRDIDIIDGIQDNDRRVINYLKKIGYGYAEFAKSVELGGMVSQKQRECMERMVRRVSSSTPRNARQYRVDNKTLNEYQYYDQPSDGYYDEGDEQTSPGWHGYTEYNGSKVSTKWHDDGRTTYYWGGPCAPTTYDENGEECC